uniref:Uncharacterized protein n=1 Tax=Anopheles atroparvus TaxID=41427 RepID=A0AAG5CYT8_ANOAO
MKLIPAVYNDGATGTIRKFPPNHVYAYFGQNPNPSCSEAHAHHGVLNKHNVVVSCA